MRTLVATALANSKGNDVYCTATKMDDRYMKLLRNTERQVLEEMGFTFIKMVSLEYPNIKGHAIFFEGHMDEMQRALKSLEKVY
ncbi:MAG: hypothetical protein ABFD08_07665 [Syntrophomonas sp.]